MAQRQGRIRALITKDVADIIFKEVKNPNIGMVSVNEVKINADNSIASVYVSFFLADNPEKRLLELKKSEGFVRSSLAKKLDLYKVPKIVFLLDDSFAKNAELEETLAKEKAKIDSFKK